jgi:hypothetical protein
MPARSVIEKVIPRSTINLDDCYFPWANNFALLSGAYIARVAHCTPTGRWIQRYPDAPGCGGGGDYHDLRLGNVQLTIDFLHPAGWMIELSHEEFEDWDGRILTFVRADMPVLCPTFRSAMQVAEASFPNPNYHLYWRPTMPADGY